MTSKLYCADRGLPDPRDASHGNSLLPSFGKFLTSDAPLPDDFRSYLDEHPSEGEEEVVNSGNGLLGRIMMEMAPRDFEVAPLTEEALAAAFTLEEGPVEWPRSKDTKPSASTGLDKKRKRKKRRKPN
eukprot:TRINITY_DN921_c0_g1_i1.p1 TRINITY_DN921_c0_g1~~TRINITY_DN921_c0_g1_i1.p1  ORF type:complete len:128 (-),score=30.27 TRINITY_DN921_c0_g1_i1:37-420(-)